MTPIGESGAVFFCFDGLSLNGIASWYEISETADTNPALQKVVDKMMLIYRSSKENDGNLCPPLLDPPNLQIQSFTKQQQWYEIRGMKDTNPALQKAFDEMILIYRLTKDSNE